MKYKRYPSYKDSGVEWLGEIPTTWNLKPFWSLYRRQKRTGYPSETLLSVYRDFGVVRKSSRDDNNNNKASEDLSGYQIVYPSDVAMNKMKAWQGSLGVSKYQGIVSPAYFVFESLHNHYDAYLHHLMRSPRYIAGYLRMSKGIRVNQWDLDPQYHSRMQITLPSYDEQKSIATYLDKATTKIDTLIEKQTKLIELLKEKRQAVISSAVTRGLDASVPMKDSGVEWLGEIPEGWSSGRLKQVSKRIIVGIAEAATHAYADEGVPILRATNIRKGKIIGKMLYLTKSFANSSERQTKKIKKNDLVTVRTGNAGVTAIASEEFDGSHCFTMLVTTLQKSQLSKFFEYLVGSNAATSYFILEGWGTAQVNISVPILQNLPISLPSFKEQSNIVNYLNTQTSKIDNLISKSTQGIVLLKEKRTALISAAVTGKIDVRDAA
jgi:type I restriction enzyme, S subunit